MKRPAAQDDEAIVINGKAPSQLAGGLVTVAGSSWREQATIDADGTFKLSVAKGSSMDIVLEMPGAKPEHSTAVERFLAAPTVSEQQQAARIAAGNGQQVQFEQEMHTRLQAATRLTGCGSCNTLVPGPCASGCCPNPTGNRLWHFWVCHGCQTAQFWADCVNASSGCSWREHGWTCIDHACECEGPCEQQQNRQDHWRENGRNWITWSCGTSPKRRGIART